MMSYSKKLHRYRELLYDESQGAFVNLEVFLHSEPNYSLNQNAYFHLQI